LLLNPARWGNGAKGTAGAVTEGIKTIRTLTAVRIVVNLIT
jgi:hypothetical protein